MKKAVIMALAALNVGLLAWVLTLHSTPAAAQAGRGAGADFLQVSARVSGNAGAEAIYIIDIKTRTIKGWYYDAKGNLQELRGRDLAADFNQDSRR